MVSLDYTEYIQRTTFRLVCSFLEALVSRKLDVAYVRKVNSVCKFMYKVNYIVFGVCTKRAGAKCETVVFAVV